MIVQLTLLALIVTVKASRECDGLAVYKVTVETFWDENNFPKDYPTWGPKGEWSKVMGFSHAKPHVLFQEGELASNGLRKFSELGDTSNLEKESKNFDFLDSFRASAIPNGNGQTSTNVFVTGQMSKISLVSKMIPSPDWFLGIDSYELCKNGRFIERAEIKLDLYDSGTDNGLTYTSPNWPLEGSDVKPVSKIDLKSSAHPASAFHYSNMKELPDFAKLKIFKIRGFRESKGPAKQRKRSEKTKKSSSQVNKFAYDMVQNDQGTQYKSRNRKRHHQQSHQMKTQASKNSELIPAPEDCLVSAWSIWSPCSKPRCHQEGGVEKRFRKVLRTKKRGGKKCPKTREYRECRKSKKCLSSPLKS